MLEFAHISSMIDPDIPCHMEGYHDRIATSIHDHLYMNTIYIKQETSFVLHVVDTIIITKELANRIKKESALRYSISEDQVIVTCIHTHSGPAVSNIILEDAEVDQDYIEFLVERALQNTQEALAQAFQGTLFYGTTKVNDFFCNRNGKDLPFNNTAYLWKVVDLNQITRFVIVNMGCHPTILKADNLAISTDFIGEMRVTYEAETGVPLIFINAEGGDVSTRLIRQGNDFQECARVGKGIAKLLLKADINRAVQLLNPTISSYQLTIDYNPKEDQWLCTQLNKFKGELSTLNKDSTAHKNLAFMFYNNLKKIYEKDHVFLQPTCWVVEFDDFRFVTIPGELVTEFGRRLRSVDEKPMFILTYANDFNIYAVNKEQYGSYFESFNTMYPYGKADEMIEQTISLYKK